MIDHSLLHPTMTDAELEAGCKVAAQYQVASVCIKPYNSFYAYDADVSSNVIQVYIHNLRRKLGKNIVRTVQSFGYIMDENY